MKEICVDANLVVKWYVFEELRDEAVALLDECDRHDIRLIAPDCVITKAASAIRRKVYRKLITPEEGLVAVSLLIQTRIDCVSVLELVPDAWYVAEKYDLASLYDAYYLALAEGRGCDFWTADERFINSISGVPYVRQIAAFTPGMLER